MEAFAKVQKLGHHVLLAICDAELLGKTFKDSGFTLEVKEEFYRGFKIDVKEAMGLIDKSTIVNLIGHNSVNSAIKEGYVHSDAVIKICGIPHAQIVKI